MSEAPTYFFVHVMKTGGTTLLWMLHRKIFSFEDSYPGRLESGSVTYLVNPYGGLKSGAIQRKPFIAGHFPLFVKDAIAGPVRTLCVLREPVDRAISHLKHARRAHGGTFESIYSDETFREQRLHNLMTRQLGSATDADAKTIFDLPAPKDRELDRAIAALETIDVLGTSESMGDMRRDLKSRFGWDLGPLETMNVSPAGSVPAHIVEQLHVNNHLDRKLYEAALELLPASKVAGTRAS